MAKLDILISGAGIAGPVLAYWLKRGVDCSITIVERSPVLRVSGKNIDIRGSAVDVIRQMNLEEKVKSKRTNEIGLAFVDGAGCEKAKYPKGEDSAQQSFTSQYEILRGDLVRILFDASKESAQYIFDESIMSVEQTNDYKAQVVFTGGHPKTSYDLVVLADGLSSQGRKRIFGKGENGEDYIRPLGQYCAYFTIPKNARDDNWARWYNATRGRVVFLRPSNDDTTRAYLAVTRSDVFKFNEVFESTDIDKKRLLKDEFVGAGWQTERVLSEMENASDFHCHMVAQVKMLNFVKGNVALVGDSGYCPSPISGMGSSLAIMGAYVLAGEISETPFDIPQALKRYQTAMKPLVHQSQKLPPGAPQIANPQTQMGISVLYGCLAIASSNWIAKLASVFPRFTSVNQRAPAYPRLQQ
ncbi:FAD/NAD(P)-binding domain-containing protein [Penicillium frequentans]|uniref:FAD/NAD(P)-binding domain-containing protein n=1 Tax=Penicillium frequentans TaxID=3151616 RepID=A0AAD6D692_9EURO|nr:FAD/NAD(P)-binding domain-containing protein [Penicillium glabrum]